MSKSLTEMAVCDLREKIGEHERRFHLMTARGREITDSYEIALRFDRAKALLRYIKKLEGESLGEWRPVPAGQKVRKGDMVWVSRRWEIAEEAVGERTADESARKCEGWVWKTKRMVKKGDRR